MDAPYTLEVDPGSGTYAEVILGFAEMLNAWIGYDATGRLRIDPSQDDLLDSYGDERLGKAIGGDILEGKKTYLMVTAMSRADEPTREILRHTYRDATLTDAEKIARVKEVYDRLDIPRLTEQQISLRFERALATLDSLSADPARTLRMREFAEGLMGRKK